MNIQQQEEQHKEWVGNEGGIEHPTHMETLLEPRNRERINWLREHCDSPNALDIGCNWGYVTNEIGADYGVDINPENIVKAILEFPDKHFLVADATTMPFPDKQFDIVIMAEILEHLEWVKGVCLALFEALRLAKHKILITLPMKPSAKCAFCFKHKWIPSPATVDFITIILSAYCREINFSNGGNYICIEALL